MNLKTAISIYGGGPGSGCNPAAWKCGRTKTKFSNSQVRDLLFTWTNVPYPGSYMQKQMKKLIIRLGTNHKELYRGMSILKSTGSGLKKFVDYRPGQEVYLESSSFSKKKRVAMGFAKVYKEDAPVLLHIVGGVNGLDINRQIRRYLGSRDYGLDWSATGSSKFPYSSHHEVVVNGKFIVLSNELASGGMRVITLKVK